MLLDEIKAASLAARQAHDTDRASLLVTLYAEAARVGKDKANRPSTDDEVVATVRKFLNGVADTLAVLPAGPAREKALAEQAVLDSFRPKQTTAQEIQSEIDAILAGIPRTKAALGAIMQGLKSKFGANFDGSVAKSLAMEAISRA